MQLFQCPSVNVFHFPDNGFFSRVGVEKVFCFFFLCVSKLVCKSIDEHVSKFGWAVDKRVEPKAQGPGDLSGTSSLFFLERFSCWSDWAMETWLF